MWNAVGESPRFGSVLLVMPRMVKVVVEPKLPTSRPGTSPVNPCALLTPARCNSAPLRAMTVSGTFCRFSARFCAVTITSCNAGADRRPSVPDGAPAGSGGPAATASALAAVVTAASPAIAIAIATAWETLERFVCSKYFILPLSLLSNDEIARSNGNPDAPASSLKFWSKLQRHHRPVGSRRVEAHRGEIADDAVPGVVVLHRGVLQVPDIDAV